MVGDPAQLAVDVRNYRLVPHELIAEGQANKQVTVELGIGVKSVKKRRQRLMERLNIHDTAGLTRYAIEAGIIESSVQLTIV